MEYALSVSSSTMDDQKIQTVKVERYLLKSTLVRKEKWVGISSITSSGILAFSTMRHSGIIEVIDIENRRKKKKVIATNLWLYKIKITPDGKKIMALEYHKTITVWSVEDQSMLFHLGHGDNLIDCVISQDSKMFFQRLNGSSIDVISLENGSRLMVSNLVDYTTTLEEKNTSESTIKMVYAMMIDNGLKTITCMALSSDDKVLVTCWKNRWVVILDVDTGKIIKNYSTQFDFMAIASTSVKSQFVLKDGYKTISMWNMDTRETLYSINIDQPNWEYHGIFVYNPHNGVFVYPTLGASVAMQDTKTRVAIELRDTVISSLSFNKDGKKLFVFEGNTAYILDADIYPFWNTHKHHTFSVVQKRTIQFLFNVNRIAPKNRKRKRKRSVIKELPRDVLLYIFSFIERDY